MVAPPPPRRRRRDHTHTAAPSPGPTWDGYPPDWPRCVSCERPALDGHLTCGELRCDEQHARETTRPVLDKRNADALRQLQRLNEAFRRVFSPK
jgi:hypothetical protein